MAFDCQRGFGSSRGWRALTFLSILTAGRAFVEQPQTNGVVERFNRTLKEQAIYGKVLRNIEEVRRAVGKFVEDYNAEWRVEKNGFVSPRQARQAWFAALSQQAA